MGDPDGDPRVDDRIHVLSGALRAFAEATTDYERLLNVVARTVSDVVADGCIVRLLSDGGWLTPVAFHFPLEACVADTHAAAEARAFMTAPRNVAEYAWGQRLIETGEAFLLPRLDIAQFRAVVTPEVAKVYETIGIHSMLVVVLRLRGESIGTLTLFRFDPASPSFDAADQEMAQALADHAALAIGNARSYAAERAAREEAEKATARFARLSEAGVIGTVVIDLDNKRVVDVNDTLLHLIGYSRDELVSGRVPWASLTAPEWSDVDARAIEQLTTTGVAGLREKELTRKDGTRASVLAGSAMLGGGTTECISFVLDLTERKEAERGRREAERRAQRMVESATVGMWTLDQDGRTTFMNARMANIFGVEAANAVGTSFEQFLAPQDWPDAGERLADRKAGVSSAHEQRFRKPDGSVGVLWVEGSPMHDDRGRYEGILGIVTDITERRRAEEALRASETRYRLMFDNSPLPKWMYDVETLRFLDVNEAAVREYGYAREEFLAMTIKDIRPPEDVPALLEAEHRAELQPKFGIWRLRKKGGEIIHVELTKHTFTLGDRVTRIAVGRDMTERLRLEDQLRQAQKMEAVGRLAGGVAHDFNNVLSVILSYGEMIHGDLRGDDPMRGDIQEITKAAQRAAGLTRQLLLFSRQQVVEPKVLDLNDNLAGMEKMLRRILGEDVELAFVPAPKLGRIRADPGNVEQVIMNLVVNARDAMPTGGQLTIETSNVDLDDDYASRHLGARAGPHVMLAVTDTGTGMDKATQARIFEPFFTTKEPGKGTGLGLSTVFGIAQQSGGNVWVYSEPGKGTTFKVYFPRVIAEVDLPHDTLPPTTLRGQETILLVEDEEQVRIVAQGILKRSGYRVIAAQNAGEALIFCEKHPGVIHMLLTDVVMPQMSGAELAKRIAKTRPEMKVVCMSGYTDDSIVRHGVLESGVAFLQKPFTPETLMRKVREVFNSPR
jgi:two-component system cell cycle sensor histidine kinase/response regulator CckA